MSVEKRKVNQVFVRRSGAERIDAVHVMGGGIHFDNA
jgi:hypothetical protein